MVTVLERIQHLIALAESPNENEARNAAVLAVKLMKQHRVTFALPAPRTATPTGSSAMPQTPRRPSSSQSTRRRTPGSAKNKRVADIPAEIKSPLGGDCIECGSRYRAGSSIYWMQSGGGLHPRCLDAWLRRHP
jgi:hypothetical protein